MGKKLDRAIDNAVHEIAEFSDTLKMAPLPTEYGELIVFLEHAATRISQIAGELRTAHQAEATIAAMAPKEEKESE